METVSMIVLLVLLAGYVLVVYLPQQIAVENRERAKRSVRIEEVRARGRAQIAVNRVARQLRDKAQLQLAQMQYAPQKQESRGRHRIEMPGGVRASELIGGRA